MANDESRDQAERDTAKCLNCDAGLGGAFCEQCGQAADATRYSFRSLAREIYHKFRTVDAFAAIRTTRGLLTRPGEFVREFLAGKRVGFTNPIVLFFYTFVIDIVLRRALQWLTGDPTYGQSLSGMDIQALLLVSTIFWGFLWWVFYRRSGLNLVENAVAAIYYVAAMNLLSVVSLLVSALFAKRFPHADEIAASITLVLNIAYGFVFAYQLFRERLWILIPKQIVLTIVFLIMAFIILMFDLIGKRMYEGTPTP